MPLVKFTRNQPRVGFPGFAGTANFPTLPTFEDLENRMSRFMDRAFNEPFRTALLPEAIGWVPAVDIVETAKELTLTAELPGMDQKDIDISVEDGLLTIRGEKLEEKKEEKKEADEDKKVYLYERTYGTFNRTFTLPPIVDGEHIVAEFEKGVLKIHMPKLAEVKPKGRKVEIKNN